MRKNKIIFELMKIIDDIDTTSDMFKGDYKGRSENIDKVYIKRSYELRNKYPILDKIFDKEYRKKFKQSRK